MQRKNFIHQHEKDGRLCCVVFVVWTLEEDNDREDGSNCKYKCDDDEMKWGR